MCFGLVNLPLRGSMGCPMLFTNSNAASVKDATLKEFKEDLPEGASLRFCSYDVQSLFENIPLDDAMEISVK